MWSRTSSPTVVPGIQALSILLLSQCLIYILKVTSPSKMAAELQEPPSLQEEDPDIL